MEKKIKILNKSLILFIIIIIFNSCNYINKKLSGFLGGALTDTTYIVRIPQKIGGTLLCNVDFSDTFHSWNYWIHYSYKDNNDSIINIGNGRYCSVDWKEKEQLVKYNDWLILGTECFDGAKIIIGKIGTKKFTSYELTPKNIENEKKWKDLKLNSIPDNYESRTYIVGVKSNGTILIKYRYAIKGRLFFNTGTRLIKYLIDDKTGEPKIQEILKKR